MTRSPVANPEHSIRNCYKYDILTMGRSPMDLYANDVNVPFIGVKSFAAYVGGCPTNISVGASRLGLGTVMLTPVGDDLSGDFVIDFLAREGMDVRYVLRKPGRHTSVVLLAIESTNRYPHIAYRDNCADLELTVNVVLAAPIETSRTLLISGTGLTRELMAWPCARRCGWLMWSWAQPVRCEAR